MKKQQKKRINLTKLTITKININELQNVIGGSSFPPSAACGSNIIDHCDNVDIL